jgi:hypothetical protein
VDPELLRARTRATWPCTRNLIFTYRAGDETPRDWQAALPEIEVPPIAHAIFAKLVSEPLPPVQPIDGHTYDWGTDAAAVTADSGLLVADYAMRERMRDAGPSRTVYHVVMRDDAMIAVETGSAAQRVANPRFIVQLSTTVEAIDVVTDAVLELAPRFGLTFVDRVDSPNRVVHNRRSSGQVRAFEQVLALDDRHGTALDFAWIVIGMSPAWFDFGADTFKVESAGYSALELVFTGTRDRTRTARVRLSDSRNIYCRAGDGTINDDGIMSMHYTPSREQYDNARMILHCALRWLFPDQPVDVAPELIARIPPGLVFPSSD